MLGARLGRGPTGTVFAGRYHGNGCAVALKVFHGDAVTDGDAFQADAKHVFALEHPNLGRLLDYGYDPAERRYFTATELCNGTSLAQKLRSGRCDETEARLLAAPVATALAAAHAHDVVHRGLSPSNVIIGRDGRIRVIDVRLAAAPGWPTVPAVYVAPEARAWRAIGPAADVWAIGALLFELLVGRPPDLARRFVLPAPCSREVVDVIRACLARDPNLRPWSMVAVARTLRTEPAEIPTARHVRAPHVA